MTIGPAPMIRIVETSVRLGIASACRHKKRARHSRVLGRRRGPAPREAVLDQIRAGGNAGRQGARSKLRLFRCAESALIVAIAGQSADRITDCPGSSSRIPSREIFKDAPMPWTRGNSAGKLQSKIAPLRFAPDRPDTERRQGE